MQLCSSLENKISSACLLQKITFQRKRANRRIVNEAEVLALLQTYAPVDIVEFNSSHSFTTQVETMFHTGVFVSVRHLSCNCLGFLYSNRHRRSMCTFNGA